MTVQRTTHLLHAAMVAMSLLIWSDWPFVPQWEVALLFVGAWASLLLGLMDDDGTDDLPYDVSLRAAREVERLIDEPVGTLELHMGTKPESPDMT